MFLVQSLCTSVDDLLFVQLSNNSFISFCYCWHVLHFSLFDVTSTLCILEITNAHTHTLKSEYYIYVYIHPSSQTSSEHVLGKLISCPPAKPCSYKVWHNGFIWCSAGCGSDPARCPLRILGWNNLKHVKLVNLKVSLAVIRGVQNWIFGGWRIRSSGPSVI